MNDEDSMRMMRDDYYYCYCVCEDLESSVQTFHHRHSNQGRFHRRRRRCSPQLATVRETPTSQYDLDLLLLLLPLLLQGAAMRVAVAEAVEERGWRGCWWWMEQKDQGQDQHATESSHRIQKRQTQQRRSHRWRPTERIGPWQGRRW